MKMKFIPAFAVVPLYAAVSLAFAETQRIEEVIVTAEKKAENLQSVSSSIAAYSGDRLQQAGVKDLQDLSSISPGLNVQTSGGGESTAIRLRGLGAQRFDQSVPQFVGVFVDEITQHRPGAAMAGLTDIERVEVLRGPQNVLYGKNVPAGAISIVTKKPIMNSLSGDGSVGFGNNDYRDTRLNLNLPIIEDILAARIAAYTTHRTGETDIEPADQTWGGYNQSGGRLHVLFEPNDRWSALATFNTFDATSADFQQPSSVKYVVTDPTALLNQGPQLPGEIIPGVIRGNDLSALNNAYYQAHFGSVSAEKIDPFKGDGYRDQKFVGRTRLNSGNVAVTHNFTDDDEITYLAGYQEYATGNFIDGDSTDINFSSVDSGLKTRYWSHELRWTHSADNFETMAGFFFDQETHRSYTTAYFPAVAIAYSLPADFATTIADDTKRDIDSKSAFGRVSYDLAEDWKLVVGARYSETNVSIVLPSNNDLSKSKNFHALVGEATLSYQWSPDILSYLKIANGNQSGGINMAVLTKTNLQDLGAKDSFNPAKSKYVELGTKTSLFDSSVQINADVYYQVYDGYQALVAIDSTNTYIANAGKVVVQGAEVEGAWQIDEHFRFDANLALTDAKFKKFDNAPCSNLQLLDALADGDYTNSCVTQGSQDISGKRVNEAPLLSASPGVTYKQRVAALNADLLVRTDLTYRSDFISEPYLDAQQKQGGYTLFNTNISMNWDGGFGVSLWGKNLTDKEYCSYRPVNPAGLSPWAGTSCLVAQGRQLGLTLSYKID